MALINCPECSYSPISDQAAACPKCGRPMKKAEYTVCHVNVCDGWGGKELQRLLSEGWQIVDKYDDPFPVVAYKLIR